MDLEKRFKTMTSLNAQQIDLVAMYFHFLDQVVHMENEARTVYKVMYDMNNAAKINRRFENFDISKSRSTGFVLVSGNFSNIGQILKLNNTICNQLHYYKEDLIGKRIEVLLPDAISMYHEQIAVNYIYKQTMAK